MIKSKVITPMNANDMILEKLIKKLKNPLPKDGLRIVLKKEMPMIIKSKTPLSGEKAMKLAIKKVTKK